MSLGIIWSSGSRDPRTLSPAFVPAAQDGGSPDSGLVLPPAPQRYEIALPFPGRLCPLQSKEQFKRRHQGTMTLELPQVLAELCPGATSDNQQLLDHTVKKDAVGTGHGIQSPGYVAG